MAHLCNFLRPTRELEAAILGIHWVIFDINVTFALINPLSQPGHVAIILHLDHTYVYVQLFIYLGRPKAR